MEDGSGGDYGCGEIAQAEPLERGGLELAQQPVVGALGSEYPVVKLEGEVAAGVHLLQQGLVAALHQHLLGGEVGQKLVDIVGRPLRGEEFACGDIEEGHAHLTAGRTFGEIYGSIEEAAPLARRVSVIPRIDEAVMASSQKVS